MRVLLVEDDEAVASAVTAGLEPEGYVVDVVGRGDDAFVDAIAGEYCVIILDIMLPGMNGFRLCDEIRALDDSTPILMLTAKDGEYDEAEALDLGADDYLRKPFSLVVLLARLRALQRRPGGSRSVDIEVDGLTLEPRLRRCRRGSTIIDLTPREYSLLDALMRHKGEAVAREQLLDLVWGESADSLAVVHVYIGYLRDKIDRPFGTETLRTIRGSGYAVDDWRLHTERAGPRQIG